MCARAHTHVCVCVCVRVRTRVRVSVGRCRHWWGGGRCWRVVGNGVGARGAGAATKLAVNALVHGLNMVLAEALVLAERAGGERSIVYDVFASGAGGAPFVLYKREAFEQPEQAAVAFSLDLVAKDYELIAQLADEVGAPMRQASVGLEIVKLNEYALSYAAPERKADAEIVLDDVRPDDYRRGAGAPDRQSGQRNCARGREAE